MSENWSESHSKRKPIQNELWLGLLGGGGGSVA